MLLLKFLKRAGKNELRGKRDVQDKSDDVVHGL